MASKLKLADVSHEDLLAEIASRLGASGAGSEFPAPDKIDELDNDGLEELCDLVGIKYEDEDEDAKKTLCKTFYQIGAKETDELEKADVKALCVALSIKPAKDLDTMLEALSDYIAEGGDVKKKPDADEDEEAEESEEEEETADDEDEKPAKKKKAAKEDDEEEADSEEEESEEAADEEEEEEKPAKKKKKADADDEEAEESEDDEEKSDDEEEEAEESSDDIDYAKVVAKKGKYPKDEKVMTQRLAKFNAVAEEEINVKKLGAKKAYAKLLESCVDHENNIADWGNPYVRDGEAYCCGLPMKDIKFKGDKVEYIKCLVTEKVYSLDDDNDFIEKE